MPRPCATPSAQRWPIPTTRAVARATAAPRPAATSSSWSATIGLPTIGKSRVLSSATCAWTIICQFVTSARRAMNHRPVSCAICSIRHSTHFDRSRRRLRFAATPTPGSRSSRRSQASTSRARSTAVPITGRSGVGTDNAPVKPSKPNAQRNKRSDLGHLGHLGHPHRPRRVNVRPSADPAAHYRAARAVADQAVPSAAVQVQRARTAQPNVDHVLQDPVAVLPARQGQIQIGPRSARVDQPTHISSLFRSIPRGAR
jgi:hypothetical protein